MRVGTKLLLLAILPVCSVAALVVVSAVSDFRAAHQLSSYRAQARLSFALAPLSNDVAHERRAAVLVRVDPGPAQQAQLVAYERATTQAFERARARAVHVAAPVDVVGGLDAARRQRQALLLQLDAGSLPPEQAIAGYSLLTQKVLGLAAALDGGAPTPASARAAAAYGSILQAIESASRERVFVATLLAPRGPRPQPTASPWGELESAELNAFRQNAAGPLVGDLDAVLFSPAGVAVQRFRDELAAAPAAAVHATPLQQWISISGARIDALRGLTAAAGRSLDAVVSNELDSANARAVRDLALSLAALVVVAALALALRRSITGPLRDVSAAARGLAHGDITAGVDYSSRDEIGDVAGAFREVHATAERLVDEIRSKNRAVRDNRLEHRADVGGLEGVWSQLLVGMNDTMAAFAELQGRRQHAERETERIFEMSLDLLCVIGVDGYFKRVNPAFERTLGYSREVLLAQPAIAFIHPDDRKRSNESFSALGRGEPIGQLENRNLCADGSVRWLQWSMRAVPDESLIFGIGRDITQSRRAAEEQAALRQVATLVARGVAPNVVFAAVAAEVAKVLPGVDLALVGRYTSDPSIEFVGGWSSLGEADWVGKTVRIGGHNVTTAVFETGQPARVDHLQDDATAVTAVARGSGARSSAGAPILVEGQLWGVMTVASVQEERLPPGIEHELAGFTELLATAIANTQAREELAASRARLVTAADETRRRIVRDLHDGAQHGLVQTIITLNLAQRAQDRGDSEQARALFGEALGHAEHANADLRELAQGILPSVLARGGLAASVEELTERLRLPISVQVTRDRFRPEIEANAYFVVAEALTNLAKHSRARSGAVAAWVEDRHLHVDVSDDGVGGARSEGGGLKGLADRVAALGGQVQIESPQGRGTQVTATLPLE
jgi:PAS domain S-box-containing protein